MLQPMTDYSKCQARVTNSTGSSSQAAPDLKKDRRRVGLIICPSSLAVVSVVGGNGTIGTLQAWTVNAVQGEQTPIIYSFFRHSHGELPSLSYFCASDAAVTYIEIIDDEGYYDHATITP